MAPRSYSSSSALLIVALISLIFSPPATRAQLSPNYYGSTCPGVRDIVQRVVVSARAGDPRILASLTRLQFHDCFVDGCDGSLLLDDSPTIKSEKNSPANANSVRGFDVIDAIKEALEESCPGVVSCADIVVLAAEISVELAGGPYWSSLLGRRDSTTANHAGANGMPNPFEPLSSVEKKFDAVGLGEADLVALLGAHTFGRAQCRIFGNRLYNFSGTGHADPSMDSSYLAKLRQSCPQGGDGSVLNNLDPATPDAFDNKYYLDILAGRGLLQTDQQLYSTPGATAGDVVRRFAGSQAEFFGSFAAAMVKMGNIRPLTGAAGEIRKNCRRVNGQY